MTANRKMNSYYRQLTQEQIQSDYHRSFVGGLWAEIGSLQFEFMREAGLKPGHKLLDVGCGCMRGGLYFMEYLNKGDYYGYDINQSLIDAGMIEIEKSGLQEKSPNLLVGERFSFNEFEVKFDYLISISLFTHLNINNIICCLARAKDVISDEGKYFSTFFESKHSAHLDPIAHHPGGIKTYCDQDPYHYSRKELSFMAEAAGLKMEYIGDWKHPRAQKMAVFHI